MIWLQTGFLGDIILTTAAMHWAKRAFPGCRQVLITTPLGARALAGHPDVDQIVVFDKRGTSLLRAVKSLRQDLRHLERKSSVLLQVHRSARSSLLARGLGFPTVTYHESRLGILAKTTVPRIALLHETQRILLLLEAIGISRWDFQGAQPCLPQADRNLAEDVRTWADGAPLVAIAPGSVWGTKRWPKESFRKVAEELLQSSSVKIVILGTKEEREATDAVALAGTGYPDRLRNLAGQTQLDDLRALYPSFRLLLCNDSSPLHYASAFGVPSVALFGATVPALGFGPLAPHSVVVEKDVSCRPCSDHGPQTCPLGHFTCMRQISSAEVLTHVRGLLALS